MKRINLLILLFILFIPITVNASIKINNVKLVDKDETVEILHDAVIEEDTIKVGIKFHDLNEKVTYEAEITNNDDYDYELSEKKNFSTSEYITYSYRITDDNVIKKGETKKVYIDIKYEKEVPNEVLLRGFSETNNVVINMRNDMVDVPNTGINNKLIIIGIISLLLVISVFILSKQKKDIFVIIILLSIVPISVYAIEKIFIKIESYIEISDEKYFCIINNFDMNQLKINPSIIGNNNSFISYKLLGQTAETVDIEFKYYKYKIGQTINDYLNSEYNTELIYNDTECKNEYEMSYFFLSNCEEKTNDYMIEEVIKIINDEYGTNYELELIKEEMKPLMSRNIPSESPEHMYQIILYKTIFNKTMGTNYTLSELYEYTISENANNIPDSTKEEINNEMNEFNNNHKSELNKITNDAYESYQTCKSKYVKGNLPKVRSGSFNALSQQGTQNNNIVEITPEEILNLEIYDRSNGCYVLFPLKDISNCSYYH